MCVNTPVYQGARPPLLSSSRQNFLTPIVRTSKPFDKANRQKRLAKPESSESSCGLS
jgi:hypothetical protein